MLVWMVKSGSSQVVRVLSPSGGSPHVLATLPVDARVAGLGAGRIAFLYADQSLHLYSLSSGASTTLATGATATDSVFGGAISADGRQLAYAVITSTTSGSLRLLDLSGGTSSVIHSYTTATVDAPVEWVGDSILAESVVGFSDAGPQADVAIDPSTGTETMSTSIAGAASSAFSHDGVHVFDAIHSALGDDADSPGGPGPQQPFNTLRGFAVGSTPAAAYSMAHHQITVFAVSDDGSTAVYYNDSAAGGFAGISLSPQFGLFFMRAGTATQLASYGEGGRWDAGAFIDTSHAAMARHTGTVEQLVIVGPAHSSPPVIDSVAGGEAAVFVAYSPTS